MQMLKRLNTSASVLMVGAHPDDEDTALLAYLARGENARTAYLSLTRGDGGQNIIGPELGEALGLIRTEELLQARKLDGAEQYFTRAYDYGFSKTLAEAKSKWDEKVILCDVVRVIRDFRPLVVVSQFSGTTADGHGQHQFAGFISPLAVKAAADASQCVETGMAWQVRKFYVRHRGQGEPRLRINVGKYDPLLGRSYFEIAMEARSQHKSQEQGVLELRGDQFSSLNLQGTEAKETRIFEGLNTSLGSGLSKSDDLQKTIQEILTKFEAAAPEKLLPDLSRAYAAMDSAWATSSPAERRFLITKKDEVLDAIQHAAGLQIDTLADSETITPGETIQVGAKVFTPFTDLVKIKGIALVAPGWTVAAAEAPRTNNPAFVAREVSAASAFFNATAPRDSQPTQPYWLREQRDGDMFRWTFARSPTWPFEPNTPAVLVTVEVAGTEMTFTQPLAFRFADDVRGEIRRNVNIVPSVTVEMDDALMIVPYSAKAQARKLVMTITNHSKQPVNGVASLNINTSPEWRHTTSSKTFSLTRKGEKTVVSFDVTIPPGTKPGSYQISGGAMVGEALASLTMHEIAYPHIQTHRSYRRASVEVAVIDLKTAPVKVGYIAGSGDRVPEAIRQMGFNLEMISESELASGDLSMFDTIVVGIRAYQVRPDVVANNQRLLDFARSGGTLIVQYQLPAYAQPGAGLTPFPTQMGPRVADETAAVRIVDPSHPIFTFPNKITNADFTGWVQERNLYNFREMAPEYTGLLESHDAGEPENTGGLVAAKLGKGSYIYCSYSMFRQLPAGVPGAFRLLANILSYKQK
ncbi:MAG TPA: PIG-L family deacetylase [Pyrinomonadaceae bacterium]|nr:PIG-L family deacetylase [Pyrinomonadaceae bacterium]